MTIQSTQPTWSPWAVHWRVLNLLTQLSYCEISTLMCATVRPGGCFVLALLCQPQFVHNEHYVQSCRVFITALGTLDHSLMIHFEIISSDFWPHVLDIQVQRSWSVNWSPLGWSWIKWQGKILDRPGAPRCKVRVDWECVVEASVCEIFIQPTGELQLGGWGQRVWMDHVPHFYC